MSKKNESTESQNDSSIKRKPWKVNAEPIPPHRLTMDEIKEDEKLHGLVDEDHPFPSKSN
nr:hypothetical protein [Janthinobacterium sp. Marseille]